MDLLFNLPSDMSQHITTFIYTNRDNLPPALSEEDTYLLVRDSVRVKVLEIIVPSSKLLSPVCNIYIHPPTANTECFERWRKWISLQKFYANLHGVGVKYQNPFCCNHCKMINHPNGLCPHTKANRGPLASHAEEPDLNNDLLPIEQELAPPRPKVERTPLEVTHDRKIDQKGKGRADAPPTKAMGPRGSQGTSAGHTAGAKKRKTH